MGSVCSSWRHVERRKATLAARADKCGVEERGQKAAVLDCQLAEPANARQLEEVVLFQMLQAYAMFGGGRGGSVLQERCSGG